MSAREGSGRLLLVPNALDLGDAPVPLADLLPDGVIRAAAGLTHWIAEDARTTRAFLKRVDAVHRLARPLQEIRIDELPREPKGGARAEAARSPVTDWLQAARNEGHDIGLISEAGLPGVADPGAVVVDEAHRLGIEVVALPGASSLLLALAASGLNGQQFAFLGYVPQEADARRARLLEAEARSAAERQTQIVIEAPYRNDALLQAMVQTLKPDTRLSVSRALTQAGARTRSDSVQAWRARAGEASWGGAPAVFAFLAAPALQTSRSQARRDWNPAPARVGRPSEGDRGSRDSEGSGRGIRVAAGSGRGRRGSSAR